MPEPLRVWDLPVRWLHWSLAAAVATAWFTGEGSLRLHELAGYVALVVVAVRGAWGCVGGRYARFTQFVRSPRIVCRYARDVARQREAHYLGHNPLGGWMVVLLWAVVACVALTGWLYTLDRFWGMAWLEWLHRALAWGLVGLIGLHVAGVAFTSWRQRENLVGAMWNGRKRASEGRDKV